MVEAMRKRGVEVQYIVKKTKVMVFIMKKINLSFILKWKNF